MAVPVERTPQIVLDGIASSASFKAFADEQGALSRQPAQKRVQCVRVGEEFFVRVHAAAQTFTGASIFTYTKDSDLLQTKNVMKFAQMLADAYGMQNADDFTKLMCALWRAYDENSLFYVHEDAKPPTNKVECTHCVEALLLDVRFFLFLVRHTGEAAFQDKQFNLANEKFTELQRRWRGSRPQRTTKACAELMGPGVAPVDVELATATMWKLKDASTTLCQEQLYMVRTTLERLFPEVA